MYLLLHGQHELNAFSTYPYHQKNFPAVLHECNTDEGVAAALLMSSLTLLFKIMGKNKRSDKLVAINQQFKNWLKCGDLDFRLYKLIMINLVPRVIIIHIPKVITWKCNVYICTPLIDRCPCMFRCERALADSSTIGLISVIRVNF